MVIVVEPFIGERLLAVQSLTVKQYEATHGTDVNLTLDLWLPERARSRDYAKVELAVSFAATALRQLCEQGGRKLTFSVFGSEERTWTGAANRRMEKEMLTVLATIAGVHGKSVPASADRANEYSAATTQRSLVISTRRGQIATEDDPTPTSDHGPANAARPVWIDVGSEQVDHYFVMPDLPVEEADA